MGVMLDIVFATILGAAITIITLNANLTIKEAWASYNGTVVVQQMLVSNAQIVESEFRNMGCGLSNTSKTIIEARDTCIYFKMALRPEPDSDIDSLKYYTGSVNDLSSTANPNDRYLFRQVNEGNPEIVGNVTTFNLRYFSFQNDTMPTPVVDLNNIGLVEVTIEVQSPWTTFIDPDGNQRYATALWKQTRLASQNLKR